MGKIVNRVLVQGGLIFCFANTTFSQIGVPQVNDANSFFDGTYNKNYIKKHRIKSVTTSTRVGEKIIGSSVYDFRRDGTLDSMSITDSSGNLVPRFIFQFNQFGDMESYISLPHEGYGADTVRYFREYENHLLVREKLPYILIPVQHLYNPEGRRIRSVSRYMNGYTVPCNRVIDYSYDGKNRVIAVSDRILCGDSADVDQVMSDRSIHYAGGKIIQILENAPNPFNNKGNTKYTYDKRGNLLSMKSDKTSRYYMYNRKGLLQKRNENISFDDIFDVDREVPPVIDYYSYEFYKN